MDLEKAISSRKFENDYHKAVVNVLYTYGWVTNLLRERLDDYHITLQQYNVLRILRGQYPNPATVNLLKDRMLDKMSDASRIVERLVQKELVTRCTNEKDRRAVDIRISDSGLQLLEKLDQVMNLDQILQENFTAAEAKQLSDLLDKMRG